MNELPPETSPEAQHDVGSEESALQQSLRDDLNSLIFLCRLAIASAADRVEELTLSVQEKQAIARRYVESRTRGGDFNLGTLEGEHAEKGRIYQKLFSELATHYHQLSLAASSVTTGASALALDAKPDDLPPSVNAVVNGESFLVGELDLLNALIGMSVTVDEEIESSELRLQTHRQKELEGLMNDAVERVRKFVETVKKGALSRSDLEEEREAFFDTEHGQEILHQVLVTTDNNDASAITSPRRGPLRISSVPENGITLTPYQIAQFVSKECRRVHQQLLDDIDSLFQFGVVLKLPSLR